MDTNLIDLIMWPSPFQAKIHRPHFEQRTRLLDALVRKHAEFWQAFDLSTADQVKRTVEKLANCCRNPVVQWSEEKQRIIVVQQRCKHRLCPLCQRQRSWNVERKLSRLVEQCDSPRFLTLTLQSSDAPLAEQMQQLSQAFAKLRRSKLWKATQQGGCYTIECTYNHSRKQWHPHIHAIIEGQYVEHSRLKEAWRTASDGSSIVDIRLVKSRVALVKYIAKYVAKSNDVKHVPDELVWEWAEAVRGLRMVGTFGILHGIKPDEAEQDEYPSDAQQLAPLNSLIEAADNGDTTAVRLLAQLREIHAHHTSLSTGRTPDGDQPDECETARSIRSWWSNLQETRRNELARIHDPPGHDCLDNRPLWEREIEHDCRSDLPV